MASHLRFSGSGFSSSSSGSPRSGGQVQGRRQHAPPPPPAVGLRADAAEEPGWTRVRSRNEIKRSRRLPPPLPTRRTWGVRPVPPEMRGLCYNCLDPGHISAFCDNPTRCFLCGQEFHQSRNCPNKWPRSSPVAVVGGERGPRKAAPRRGGEGERGQEAVPMEQDSNSTAESAAPVGNSNGGGVWRDVVCGRGPAQAQEAALGGGAEAGFVGEEEDVCVISPSADMVDREELLLRRAVLVTITGTRPAVDMADAASLIHAKLHLGPYDFSIRPYAPEDFLILCSSVETRDSIINERSMDAPRFSLAFKPWIRQLQAELHHAPYLACVDLLGVPAHAWESGTAQKLLRKAGWIEGVDRSTARWDDMSKFSVQLWTEDPRRIPPSRALDIVEPDVGAKLQVHRPGRGGNAKKTLRYKIRFVVTDVRGGGFDPLLPPEVSPPSSDPESRPAQSSSRNRRAPSQARGGYGGGRHHGGGGGAVWRPRELQRQRHRHLLAGEGSSATPSPPAGPAAATAASSVHAGPTAARADQGVQPAADKAPADGSVVAEGPVGPDGDAFFQIKARNNHLEGSPASVIGPRAPDNSPLEKSLGEDSAGSADPLAASAAATRQASSLCKDKTNAFDGQPRCDIQYQARHIVTAQDPFTFTFGAFRDELVQRQDSPRQRGHVDLEAGTRSMLDKSSIAFESVEQDSDWLVDQPEDQLVPSFGTPARFVMVDIGDEDHGSVPTGLVNPQANCSTPVQHSSPTDTPVQDGFFTPAPQDRGTEILNELLAEIRAHTRSPLLPLPNIQVTRRRNKKYTPGGAPRRSLRLALKAPTRPASMVKRSQRVLMGKMGICRPEEVLSPEHLQQYAKVFEEPLTEQQLQALAALFALSVPEESEQSLCF